MGTGERGVRAAVQARPLLVFTVLVLALSWPMLLLGERVGPFSPLLTLLDPSGCAFLVVWLAEGPAGVRELAGRLLRWRAPARWYLFGMGALLLGAGDAVAATLIPAELPVPPTGALVVLPVNFVVIFLLAGLGEEFGWRGFALPRFQERTTPVRATLAVGLLWWAWHIPVRVSGPAAACCSSR